MLERRKRMLDLISQEAGISVSQISKHTKVSVVTVRNDLETLASEGLIVRTHGGAVPAFHPHIIERQKANVDKKEDIARYAAGMIQDGDHVIIVAGTTTSLMGKHLLGKRDIHVVTNSTLLLPYARVNPSLQVTLVGGEFKAAAEAMVGPIALRELGQFHVGKSFIGSDGFTVERGITANQIDVAEVVRKAITQSSEVILLADSTKFGKSGFAYMGDIGCCGHFNHRQGAVKARRKGSKKSWNGSSHCLALSLLMIQRKHGKTNRNRLV